MSRSIFTSFVWPMPAILAGVAGILYVVLGHELEREAIERAEVEARHVLEDIRAVRTYYAENVVARVIGSGGIRTSTDYAGEPETIPYPATFLHDLGRIMSSESRGVDVFSPYPFAGRAGREIDPDRLEAWNVLRADPGATFSKRSSDSRRILVAIADTMAGPSCVSCHNTHPDSSKRDWVEGDVRAILSYTLPMDPVLAKVDRIRRHMAALIGGVLVLGLFVYLVLMRHASRRLRRALSVLDRVASGETRVELPEKASLEETDRIYEAVKRTVGELAARNERLIAQNARFDAALNNMPHGLCMFDAQKRLIVCNKRYADMYRLPADLTTRGTPLPVILEHRRSIGAVPCDETTLANMILDALAGQTSHTRMALIDGRTIEIDHEPLAAGGWVSTHQDVTQEIESEGRIRHLARHDPLTDLPNRAFFAEHLNRAFVEVAEGEVAVLCLDLDGFKPINDTLGHSAGDALLVAVAARMRELLAPGDFIARLGGDEFTIVRTGHDLPESVRHLASAMIDAMRVPFDVAGHRVVVGVSVGVAIAPGDGGDGETLLKNADMALYRAKGDGRGVVRFFEPEMDARMRERRLLEADLRRAVADRELELFYQPIVCATSERITAFEALLRWRHPERGLVSPLEFVSIAEETGLIVEIGAFVLEEACRQATSWPGDVKVSVNLSPVQFRSRAIVDDVVSALRASGLSAERLQLEITETVLLADTVLTIGILSDFERIGVCIAMDDFGTGYSSLSYLRKFPVDKIKIDKSFVHDLDEAREGAAIIRAIVGLGASLGISVVAEGVETREQFELLRREGCAEVQGYLFSKPVPSDEVSTLLAASNGSRAAA